MTTITTSVTASWFATHYTRETTPHSAAMVAPAAATISPSPSISAPGVTVDLGGYPAGTTFRFSVTSAFGTRYSDGADCLVQSWAGEPVIPDWVPRGVGVAWSMGWEHLDPSSGVDYNDAFTVLWTPASTGGWAVGVVG